MAGASLAALYRPQTFAEVVGQDMVKSILSRASQEDRVAPAYLLSGTRGVGKTTIARIFAKALNCAQAPTAEPCNVCDACRRITQGSFVDVVEIDGASNRGIDDVRRLRDAVGYAALEGRYKVFIIDEAHMLTKEAFNALLKTLEEPPPRVTFVMATTEQHKFPVTIVSRCQHFVFRQIPEARLEEHIISILKREQHPFDPEAPRLIARRASGSVRDAMSLLGQVLAGSEGELLTTAQARTVLGLAGREIMSSLLDHITHQDATAIATQVRELLAQGVDMGFFLRELGSVWRNLFLVRQIGQTGNLSAVLPDLSENEVAELPSLAGRFSLSYIHAAWQMTLDAQRRILTSLEPASGLELLLLNLAMLPKLLPLEELSPQALVTTLQLPQGEAALPGESRPEPTPAKQPLVSQQAEPISEADASPITDDTPHTQPDTVPPPAELLWEKLVMLNDGKSSEQIPNFHQLHGEREGDNLILHAATLIVYKQMQCSPLRERLERLVEEWAGRSLKLEFVAPTRVIKTEHDLRAELEQHPVVQTLQQHYDATILRCSDLSQNND